MDDVSDEAGASLSQSFGMDKADIFFGRTLKLTFGWKIRSHGSENGKKIMGEDPQSLENHGFPQISQLVLHSRQRTLKPQRFQGSFYTIPAGVFPLFFPLQVFKGDFQGGQAPRRRAAQDARVAANPTALSDFQHPGKGTNRQAPADLRSPRQAPKSANVFGFVRHPGNRPRPPGNVRGAPG